MDTLGVPKQKQNPVPLPGGIGQKHCRGSSYTLPLLYFGIVKGLFHLTKITTSINIDRLNRTLLETPVKNITKLIGEKIYQQGD